MCLGMLRLKMVVSGGGVGEIVPGYSSPYNPLQVNTGNAGLYFTYINETMEHIFSDIITWTGSLAWFASSFYLSLLFLRHFLFHILQIHSFIA